MASGSMRKVCGAFYGTGAQLDVRTVGFRPVHVKLINAGGLVLGEWMEGMADASALKQVNADTTQIILASTNGITPLSDGFRLGADTDLNVSGELVHYAVEG